jgi:hypothetical protein
MMPRRGTGTPVPWQQVVFGLPGQYQNQYRQQAQGRKQYVVTPSGNYSNHNQSPKNVVVFAFPYMGTRLYISRPWMVGNSSQNRRKISDFRADDE